MADTVYTATTSDGQTDMSGSNRPTGTDWLDSIANLGGAASSIIAAANGNAIYNQNPNQINPAQQAQIQSQNTSTLLWVAGIGFVFLLLIGGLVFVFLKGNKKASS